MNVIQQPRWATLTDNERSHHIRQGVQAGKTYDEIAKELHALGDGGKPSKNVIAGFVGRKMAGEFKDRRIRPPRPRAPKPAPPSLKVTKNPPKLPRIRGHVVQKKLPVQEPEPEAKPDAKNAHVAFGTAPNPRECPGDGVHCEWPVGDPREKNFVFCWKEVPKEMRGGHPYYCEHHQL
jgi:hypothetical protein